MPVKTAFGMALRNHHINLWTCQAAL